MADVTVTHKRYLGDGVYVAVYEGRIKMTTEDGYQTTNVIYLEPEVLLNLELYIHELKQWNFTGLL